MADEEAKRVEESNDSIKFLVQIFKEIEAKSEAAETQNTVQEPAAVDDGTVPKETVAEVKEESQEVRAQVTDLPKEPLPVSQESVGAEKQAAPQELAREMVHDSTPQPPASALDFDLANQILTAAKQLDETPVKEETAPEVVLAARDLSAESETEEAAPRSLARDFPMSPEIMVPETPALAEPTPSSISYLVKIYREANNLHEPNTAKEKEQLGVAIKEISRNELGKLSLKPDDMSIKITEVDESASNGNFSRDANDSTTYLVQIVKDVMIQDAPMPSIIEAIKIETAVLVATKDLPKEDSQPTVVESIEHQVTVTTQAALPAVQPPILIQEVAKENLDFQVDESSSVTYLVQIVNDILGKPPRYPHETDTSIKPQQQLDLLVTDRMNHLVFDKASEHEEEDKLQELTTSQISDGVDSLINELNNQLVHNDLEHELTSNAMVESMDSYDFNASTEVPLARPAPKDVNLNEVAHEIVISAVSGAQNKANETSFHLTSPSQNEFNKLGTVEYITRDRPILVSETAAVDLPTFTMNKPQVDVNVTKPTFTKDYLINLQGPKIEESHVISTGKDLNFSLTRPSIPAPHYSYNHDAGFTVAGPTDFSLSKEVNLGLTNPEIKLPHFSLNQDVNTSTLKPSVTIPPPFSLTSDFPDDWSISADQPTRDIPKVGAQPGHFLAGEVVINAGLAKPHLFNTEYETALPVTSGSRFDPYEILRAYSTTSTEELLRHFNDELPGARQCRIIGDPISESQFGVGFKENASGPYSISDVKSKAQEAGVREGDLIIAVNNVYVVGVTEKELIVQFLEAKKSNELLLELIEPHKCPVDVRSVIAL